MLLRAGLVLLGVLLALLCLIAYRQAWYVAGVLLPWGLALALLATYATVRAAAYPDGPAAGAMACGAGWVVTMIVLFRPRDEGDYLLAADVRGYGLLLGGMLVVTAAVVRAIGAPAVHRLGCDDASARR